MFEILLISELSLILFILIYKLISEIKTKRLYDFNKDDYLVSLKVLEDVTNNYKTVILEPKISGMTSMYDLDPSSQLNSIKQFNVEKNKLINESTKEILKQLSGPVLTKLLQYYSEQGLLYIIISNLRSI